MSTFKLPLEFFLVVFIALGISLGIHLLVLNALELPLFENLLVRSYVVNLVLATLIFYALYHYRKKLQNALGFLFMGGSLVKFIAFFILFYPTYKADGEMQKVEFAAFFVPYLIALVLETWYASKMLNNIEKDAG